jgi:sodium-type flagellar protein MotY
MAYRIITLLLCLLLPTSAQAIRHYQASIEQSQWTIQTNKVRCELNHQIPGYGLGSFVFSSGGELSFVVKATIPLIRDSVANVLSKSPFWRTGSDKELGQLSMTKGKMPFYVSGDLVTRMMYELDLGMFPTFQYKDFFDKSADIQVGISSIKFKNHLPEFWQCISELINFDSLKSVTVNYSTGKFGLSSKARQELESLAIYARYDKSIEIFIEGHTDNRGTRRSNLKLSKRRTGGVKSFFLSKGVDDKQIKFRSFGEKHPATRKGRRTKHSSNRRVEVTFSRPK